MLKYTVTNKDFGTPVCDIVSEMTSLDTKSFIVNLGNSKKVNVTSIRSYPALRSLVSHYVSSMFTVHQSEAQRLLSSDFLISYISVKDIKINTNTRYCYTLKGVPGRFVPKYTGWYFTSVSNPKSRSNPRIYCTKTEEYLYPEYRDGSLLVMNNTIINPVLTASEEDAKFISISAIEMNVSHELDEEDFTKKNKVPEYVYRRNNSGFISNIIAKKDLKKFQQKHLELHSVLNNSDNKAS